jgi:hypothetical protein
MSSHQYDIIKKRVGSIEGQMLKNSVPKRLRTRQGKKYAEGMSRFLGQDVASSEPAQNYDKAVVEGRIGRKRKREKKT